MPVAKKTAPVKRAVPAATFSEPELTTNDPVGPVEFSWDSLDEAVERPAEAVTPRVNVEQDTPAAIKGRVINSYDVYMNAVSVEGASQSEINRAIRAAWRSQTFPNTDVRDEFLKLARRYCAKGDTPRTLRAKIDASDELCLYFLAKPREDHRGGES